MIQILQKEASLTDTVSDVIIVLAEGKTLTSTSRFHIIEKIYNCLNGSYEL